MVFISKVAIWVVLGCAFGVAYAIVTTTLGCTPRVTMKPDVLRIWMLLLGLEFAAGGLIVGTMYNLVARRSFPSVTTVKANAAVGAAVLICGILLASVIVGLSPPLDSCVVP